MGIRAKQMKDITFDGTTLGRAPFGTDLFDTTLLQTVMETGAFTTAAVNDAFAASSIALSKLAEAVIEADGGQAFTGDQSMGSNKLTSLTPGTDPTDAINKAQLDAIAAGLSWKDAVRVATVGVLSNTPSYANGTSGVGATLTASSVGVLTVDGIATVINDRILVKTQAAASQNGIYKVTTEGTVGVAYILTRATDADESAELDSAAVFVQIGTTNAESGYTQTASAPTIGTTSLVWSQFTGGGSLVPGDGIDISANTVSVDLAAAGSGTGGLEIVSTEIAIQVGDGIQLTASGVEVDLAAAGSGTGGLIIISNEIAINAATAAGIELTASGIAVNLDSAGAGTGGLDFNSGAVRVDAGLGIVLSATGVDVDPAQLIQGGNAEIDGDFIDIDYAQTNYTPGTSGVATDINHLAAHLEGIDLALAAVGGTSTQEDVTTEAISGADTDLTDTLSSAPTSAASLRLFLNGVFQIQGAGKDYTITSDTIKWLQSTGTAVIMDTSDVLTALFDA